MQLPVTLAILAFVGSTGAAQSVPVHRVKDVTTPAMRFIGVGSAGDSAPAGPTAGPPPNAPDTLPGVTVILKVPYSFEHPHKDVKRAVIHCALLLHPNSSHVAEEQIVIPVNGRSASGTAPVTFAPVNNRNVGIARAYACQLVLSDGRATVFAFGAKQPWALSESASVLIVRGTID